MIRPSYTFKLRFMYSFIFIFLVVTSASAGGTHDRNAWMKEAWVGVMNHYIADWMARKEKIKIDVAMVLGGTRPSRKEVL